MRARSAWAAAATAFAIRAVCAAGGSAQKTPTAPTFNHDIAPILYARCAGCHRPNDAAPMPLLTYEDARPWAQSIKNKVVAHEMPPWPADPRYGRFQNENTLTGEQVATIAAWVDGGAPRGDGTAPRPPRFVDGWTSKMNRPPDLVIDAPVTFDLPASGQIPIVTVWTKRPIRSDEFIEAVELRPTNRAAVHHAAVFRAKLPAGVRIGKGELWPGGPVADGVAIQADGTPAAVSPDRQAFGTPLVFYVPSGGVLKLASGVGKRIEQDEYLLWMFHLTTSGTPQQASAKLGVWYSRSEIEYQATTAMVTEKVLVDGQEVARDSGGPIIPDIPAGDAQFTVTGAMSVRRPIILYSLWPHMHSRGRDMTFSVRDPKGNEQTILSVPRFNFDWQFTYELATPLKIQAGSTIQAVAHYDNSAANRNNPDPSQPVTWGPQATDEMFNPFLEIAPDRSLRPFVEFEHR